MGFIVEQDIGFEPMTFSLATRHSTTELILQIVVPHDRIELPYSDYKTDVIPLYE